MTDIDFAPHTRYYTIVCNAEGEEIDRLDGKVLVKGKDYADQLPIEYRHIEVTTQLINIAKIER